MSSEADVGRLAEIIEKKFGKLDILVSNAGVYGPKGAIEDVVLVRLVAGDFHQPAWEQCSAAETFLPCFGRRAREDPSCFRRRRHQTSDRS